VTTDTALARWRRHFPILERVTYLNSCSQGALSDAVAAAYRGYLHDWDEKGSPWELWVAKEEAVRRAFAALIGAAPSEVAVTASVSAGASALVSGFPIEPSRTRLVVTDLEFPTIGQICHAQERRGLEVVEVRAEGATIPLERFAAAIDERTALVALTHVCYRNGTRNDVRAVVELAHAHGAPVLLDAYQAVGALDIDVAELGVDFLVAGALKYLLASAGLGFLYCRSSLVERIVPTVTGWFADEDIFAMDVHDYSPAPDARRFQAGTPPVPSIYAAVAGIGLLEEVGVPAVERHVGSLGGALIAGIEELGGTVVTPRRPEARGPMVAVASADAPRLVAALEDAGIVTSSRDGNLRVSFHGYNDHGDVARILEVLARQRPLLA